MSSFITLSISSLGVEYQNCPRHQQQSPPQERLPLGILHQMHWKVRTEEMTSSVLLLKTSDQRCLLEGKLSPDILAASCASSTQSLYSKIITCVSQLTAAYSALILTRPPSTKPLLSCSKLLMQMKFLFLL